MESEVDEESRDSQVLDVIPVRLEENYENQNLQLKITSTKGKYYKQTYRTAWEQMPDFKGWLRGVQGEPTRAFCTYCQKTLHAHRLSLLKHTCTIRHQKAAQIHNTRKAKLHSVSSMDTKANIILGGNSSAQDETEAESNESLMDYARDGLTVTVLEDGDQDQDVDAEEDDDEADESSFALEKLPVHVQTQIRQQISSMNSQKPPVSTHVLDTTKGLPVAGLQVSLYKLIDGRWTYINEGITSPDGRFANFLDRNDFSSGRYKLHYDVDRYFESRKQETLYPFIEIVFDCRTTTDNYHVPLLLSPFGYTTYRGS